MVIPSLGCQPAYAGFGAKVNGLAQQFRRTESETDCKSNESCANDG